MKFCLIGCGGIVSGMHAPAYRLYREKHPDFEMAACCDLDKARAEDLQAGFGFARAYNDYHAMLAAEKPDAVAVIVSESASAQVGMDVLHARIPMLIEKPPGRFSHETALLAAAAAAGHVPCQVAFNRRYMPVLAVMREMAAGEEIQQVSYELVRCERRDRHFSDTAVHAIDAARFLANADYRRVRLAYQEMPQYGEGVCNMSLDGEMTSGARVEIRICPMSGASLERAAVHAHNRLLLGFTPAWGGIDSPGRIEDFRGGAAPVIHAFKSSEVFESNGFYAENEAFFDAIAAGRAPSPDIASAMNVMRVKECIDRRQTEFVNDGGMG
jgi:predicted dehydrogenase